MLARLTFIAIAAAGSVTAQGADPVAGQEIYMSYCVQCHGLDAKGAGPMAEILAIATPDLTDLTARNGGAFPTEAVGMKIDGRTSVLAHGGDMPLFGPIFESVQNVFVRLPSGQTMVMSQALADVVSYLEILQPQ